MAGAGGGAARESARSALFSNFRHEVIAPRLQCEGEQARRIVYYSKPRAEFVTGSGPLNDEAITRYFKGVGEAASGCLFEIAQREVGTISGDLERGRHYVRLAREAVERYWRP